MASILFPGNFSDEHIMQSWTSEGQPHSSLMLPSIFLSVLNDAAVSFSKSNGILKLLGEKCVILKSWKIDPALLDNDPKMF